MKRKVLVLLISTALVASLVTGCGSKSTSVTPSTEVSTETSTEAKSDTEAASETTASVEQTLAKELLTRHVTKDDVITEEVIGALIQELKSSYKFEKLDDLKVAAGEWVYVTDGKGWFEDLYSDNGTKVTAVEGTIGNEAQLMERDELHVSSRMLYPYLLYKSQGAKISAINISEDPAPQIVSILVDAKSDIKTFEDLKGKKIGSWNAGCQYVALIERTETLGWEEGKDWTYANVSQGELKTAVLAGELDAISVHPLTSFNSGIIDGSLREIENAVDDGSYVNDGGASVIFVPTEFAGVNENILKAFLKLREAVSAYILQNEEAAAAVVEGITRTPAENTIFWWERSKETSFTSNDSLENLKNETAKYQDWLIEHGAYEASSAINPDDFFLGTYIK